MRTDIHRAKTIDPTQYEWVAFENLQAATQGDIDACGYLMEQRERIQEHMAETGGTYSTHTHGGNCHICGAWAVWTVLFYHQASNTYIRTGHECAGLLDAGLRERFNRWKNAAVDALHALAGKRKAKAMLDAVGLAEAFQIWEQPPSMLCPTHAGDSCWSENPNWTEEIWSCADCRRLHSRKEEVAIIDIVRTVVKYGNLSEKQSGYLGKLLERIQTRDEHEARHRAEREAAAPCPSGRTVIEGTVLKVEQRQTDFGPCTKMLVKDKSGFMVWGTVPGNANVTQGDVIKFRATLEPSRDDLKFGFAKRPTLVA